MSDTIDLSKDLELWCDFAPRYYDSQRNRIQDKSGHGRHPEASGGPTVGVEGPANFEATSFDASDDAFTHPDPLTFQEQSIFALVKQDSVDQNKMVFTNDDGSGGVTVQFFLSTDNRLSVGFRDGSGNSVSILSAAKANKWYTVFAVYDGESLRVYLDGELVGKNSVSSHNLSGKTTAVTGEGPGSDHAGMDLSVLCRWSRALSDAEIEQLNRLTAPRRAML